MLEMGAANSSTESEAASCSARYEGECEKSHHLFLFLLLVLQVRLCAHCLRCLSFHLGVGGSLSCQSCLVDTWFRSINFLGDIEGRSDFHILFGGSVVGTMPLVSDSLLASAFSFLAASVAIDHTGVSLYL